MPREAASDLDAFLEVQSAVVGFYASVDGFDVEPALSYPTEDIESARESGIVNRRTEVERVLSARPRVRRTRHLVSNLEVRRDDPNSARARCEIIVFQGQIDHTDRPVVVKGPDAIISNEDHLVRQEGVWRIAKKKPAVVIKMGDK